MIRYEQHEQYVKQILYIETQTTNDCKKSTINNNYKNSIYWDEDFVKELKNQYNITYENEFKSTFLLKKCYNNFLIINPNGSVQYTYCHNKIKTTNIFEDNWTHNNQYVKCKNPFGINCSTKCNLSYHEK